jgi:four helix bundle protein
MNYDLEDRTMKFSENIIDMIRQTKTDALNKSIINQLVRSATSVGANYCEANGASSKKDFKNKIHICKKEIKETKYWLQLISRTNPEIKGKLRVLWQEAQELTLIFSKITATMSEKSIKN